MNKQEYIKKAEEIIREASELKFAVTEILCGGSRPCYEHAMQAEEIAQAILKHMPEALYQLHLEGVREIENYFNRQGDFLIPNPFDHETMIEVFDKKDILEFLEEKLK